ncbi:chymotrypsin inhibitor-like isoform X2 [Rana temporaria]|uniref:chymotrypsin inhibitor-like isoform X2 n=1 Tax=Rana temporaria TaxID=8407 RepID=UPI001AAD3199|nr:chymotrypsin inhibitor-like isoform X2 [Rana temporaria]
MLCDLLQVEVLRKMKVSVTVLLCSLVVCALLIGSASSAPAPPGGCPENEEFVRCGKTCLTTCKPWNVPLVCNRMCYIGCDCRKEYQRNSAGTCVRPEECN